MVRKNKAILAAILWLLMGIGSASAQYAYRIRPMPALPASCNPLNGEVVYLTTGSTGIYYCFALNQWKPIGMSGNQFNVNQGTLTASLPFIAHTATWNNGAANFFNFTSNITDTASLPASELFSWSVNGTEVFGGTKLGRFYVTQPPLTASLPFMNHTVTWNNGAVTFVDDFRNITDTASVAASLLAQWQVGGVNQFSVGKTGFVNAGDGIAIRAAGSVIWTGRSIISSTADGRFNVTNGAGTGFSALTFGPEAVTNPRINVSPPVAGQTQGIILLKGDGSPAVFADLGAGATNGSMIYCSNCVIAGACIGAGSGAIAKRLNGAWICN
jgi:hypothetical protein